MEMAIASCRNLSQLVQRYFLIQWSYCTRRICKRPGDQVNSAQLGTWATDHALQLFNYTCPTHFFNILKVRKKKPP